MSGHPPANRRNRLCGSFRLRSSRRGGSCRCGRGLTESNLPGVRSDNQDENPATPSHCGQRRSLGASSCVSTCTGSCEWSRRPCPLVPACWPRGRGAAAASRFARDFQHSLPARPELEELPAAA